MRLAMMARILVIGTSSPGCGCGAEGLAGAAGVGAVAAGLAAAGAPPSRWPRMSCLVIRPDAPVAGTVERSTLFSLAILRTSGEERWPSTETGGAAGGGV